MDYRKTERGLVIRLDDGDEIVDTLKKLAEREKILSATVTGIGAAKKAEIAHFDTKKKKYNTKKLEGMLEIIALNGNICILDGTPAVHIHIAISRHDFSTLSGHLMNAEVYPTCEIVVTEIGIKIERKFDEKTGLNLQSFSSGK